MAVVSITRLRLRSVRYLLPFLWHALRSNLQAKRTDGNLGVELRTNGRVNWTMTVWRDEKALRDFFLHGPHKTAMTRLAMWCDEASLVRWQSDDAGLPSWEIAEQRLAKEGRLSTVKFPSTAHAAGRTLGSAASGRETSENTHIRAGT